MCVIVEHDGRFRAYETDLKPAWGPLFDHVIPYELPAGRIVRWTRLGQKGDPNAWQEQLRLATGLQHSTLPEKRATARSAYLYLLTDAIGLREDDVHDSTGGEAAPGKVSFNLDHRDSSAHAGVAGAIPSDRTTPLPEPTLEVGPRAFGDLIALRGTLLHEFTHLGHAVKTIEAVRRWRATERKLPFLAWLERQRLDPVEHAIIAEQVTPHAESTESLAYLRGFTSSYHLYDLSAIPDDVVGDTKLFKELGYLAEEWPRAAHAVQDEVIEQLVAYRDALPPDHQARFNAYVRGRRGGAGFWAKLS